MGKKKKVVKAHSLITKKGSSSSSSTSASRAVIHAAPTAAAIPDNYPTKHMTEVAPFRAMSAGEKLTNYNKKRSLRAKNTAATDAITISSRRVPPVTLNTVYGSSHKKHAQLNNAIKAAEKTSDRTGTPSLHSVRTRTRKNEIAHDPTTGAFNVINTARGPNDNGKHSYELEMQTYLDPTTGKHKTHRIGDTRLPPKSVPKSDAYSSDSDV